MVSVFKNVGERSAAKSYHHIGILSVVRKIFEKIINNRLVNHIEKCGIRPISSIFSGLRDQL